MVTLLGERFDSRRSDKPSFYGNWDPAFPNFSDLLLTPIHFHSATKFGIVTRARAGRSVFLWVSHPCELGDAGP